MKSQQVNHCIFSRWYPSFASDTLESQIIELPLDFVEYLKADNIVLPGNAASNGYSNELNGYSDDESNDDEWEHSGNTLTAPDFNALRASIEQAIKQLSENGVFTKLNWSAPRDAAWMSPDGTLRCASFDDICLLLKSSDFIAHDLTQAYEHCTDADQALSTLGILPFELVLRPWTDISPSSEFRCFVKHRKLIAISQRHHSSFYNYSSREKSEAFSRITDFYNARISGRFVDDSFVFDVCSVRSRHDIRVLDLNPFGRRTDALMFSWEELDAVDANSHDFSMSSVLRVVETEAGIQPSAYLSYRLPRDAIELSDNSDIRKMINFFTDNNLAEPPRNDNNLTEAPPRNDNNLAEAPDRIEEGEGRS